ncbi:MAG: glycosyltransferase family 39 protein [Acidobacteriota bacterium]
MKELSRTIGSNYFWYAFLLLTVFVYFFGLSIPLLGPDEPRYAQVAREMFTRGDLVTPTLGGYNWFEKPALLYWLEITAFSMFGVSEFAARAGSAVFGLGTIASMWLLGREYEKGAFARLMAMAVATSIGIIVFSRGASFDIILTFPMTAALVCFYFFDSRSRHASEDATKRRDLIVPLAGLYFFIGVSLLAKGLVGVVFPAAIVAFYYLLSRRLPSKQFIVSIFWGTVLSAAVAATWYLPMYLRHGWSFVDEFFIQHHFQRFTSNKYQHPQPFHFFFWVLPLMTIPWLPFLAASGVTGIKKILNRGGSSQFSPLVPFAFAWMTVPLVFFSFSGSKLPGYILPSVPPAIVLAVFSLRRFASRGPSYNVTVWALGLATYLVIIGVIIFALPGFAENDSVKSLIAAADGQGYSRSRVLGLHTVSHNAEFYASGRLVRDVGGRQRNFASADEIRAQIEAAGGDPVLVLVPPKFATELSANASLKALPISENGELRIIAVSLK